MVVYTLTSGKPYKTSRRYHPGPLDSRETLATASTVVTAPGAAPTRPTAADTNLCWAGFSCRRRGSKKHLRPKPVGPAGVVQPSRPPAGDTPTRR